MREDVEVKSIFVDLLQVSFIVLKLTNIIKWSWWWVLSPLWISLGIILPLLAIVYFVSK